MYSLLNHAFTRIFPLHPAIGLLLWRQAPLYLPEERKYVPAGLTVYGINAMHKMQLQASGLEIEPMNALLYKVC